MKYSVLTTASAVLYAGALLAWPVSAISDDRREMTRKIHSKILSMYPDYQSTRQDKALAGCINWDMSTPQYPHVLILRARHTGIGSDAPIFPSKLMRYALEDCARTRSEKGSDCECVPVDKNGKPALKIPSSFMEKFRTSTEEPAKNEELSHAEVAALYAAGQRAYEEKDYGSAFKNWKRLADQGHTQAAFHVADMYDFAMGVSHSPAQAALYYLKAAERGHAEAQFRIANRYDSGTGIGWNKLEALKWCLIALKNDELSARSRYWAEIYVNSFVSVQVSSGNERAAETMERAEELARDWRPTKGLATASLAE
jgi:hypothetical protein